MKIHKNVIAMIVIMGITVIPTLYAWFNICLLYTSFRKIILSSLFQFFRCTKICFLHIFSLDLYFISHVLFHPLTAFLPVQRISY